MEELLPTKKMIVDFQKEIIEKTGKKVKLKLKVDRLTFKFDGRLLLSIMYYPSYWRNGTVHIAIRYEELGLNKFQWRNEEFEKKLKSLAEGISIKEYRRIKSELGLY